MSNRSKEDCPHEHILPLTNGYGQCKQCGGSTFPLSYQAAIDFAANLPTKSQLADAAVDVANACYSARFGNDPRKIVGSCIADPIVARAVESLLVLISRRKARQLSKEVEDES